LFDGVFRLLPAQPVGVADGQHLEGGIAGQAVEVTSSHGPLADKADSDSIARGGFGVAAQD
jgi:hypothetical protein